MRSRSMLLLAGLSLGGMMLASRPVWAQSSPPVTGGLVYHVDANDLDGDGTPEDLGESGQSSGAVSVWVDKVSGQNAIQNDPTLQPVLTPGALQGMPVVSYDGTNDILQTAPFAAPLAQPNTMFLVWRSNTAPSGFGDAVIDGLSLGGRHAIIYEARTDLGAGNPGGLILFAGAGGGSPDDYYPINFTGPIVQTAVWNDVNATNDNYIDGTLVRQRETGTDPLNGVTLGARFGTFEGDTFTINGYIAEVLIYGSLLDADQRESVESYLTNKWIVPEPSALALLGLTGLSMLRRRR